MNGSISNISGLKRADWNIEEQAECKKEAENSYSKNLSKVTDTAALSNLLPKLKGLLDAMDQPEGNVLQSISGNISSLQDAFIDTMYNTIGQEGVDFSHKMTLRLDAENNLVLAGEHPDKEKVEGLLAARPELSTAFKEIAAQSELLRDVSNIGKVIGTHSGIEAYRNMGSMQSNASYQFSIKGDMSHFYFGR